MRSLEGSTGLKENNRRTFLDVGGELNIRESGLQERAHFLVKMQRSALLRFPLIREELMRLIRKERGSEITVLGNNMKLSPEWH